jgi:hypothetical protein
MSGLRSTVLKTAHFSRIDFHRPSHREGIAPPGVFALDGVNCSLSYSKRLKGFPRGEAVKNLRFLTDEGWRHQTDTFAAGTYGKKF